MTASPDDPRTPLPLAPADEEPRDPAPAPRSEVRGRLDPALDPDRYDAPRDVVGLPIGPLDPALDPDLYHLDLDAAGDLPPGQGQTLPGLLGEGAYEEKRDNWQWALGLLGVIVFLGLVSWFFGSVVRY